MRVFVGTLAGTFYRVSLQAWRLAVGEDAAGRADWRLAPCNEGEKWYGVVREGVAGSAAGWLDLVSESILAVCRCGGTAKVYKDGLENARLMWACLEPANAACLELTDAWPKLLTLSFEVIASA
jgi:hypothetical protein